MPRRLTQAPPQASHSSQKNEAFLIEQLPDRERKLFDECTNGPQVLAGISKLRLIEQNDGNSKGVRRFIEALHPLCSALDVLCQVDPIHFATVWGGIRVVLQLASNYERFSRSSLRGILEDVFRDLLEYLIGVTKIFFRSNGLTKSKIRVLARAVWKPFRFDETLNQMKVHRRRAADELLLLQIQGSGDAQPAGQQRDPERRQPQPDADYDLFHRIRGWLAPSSFRARFDAARQARLPGTSTWIFQESAFEAWMQGMAGDEPCHLWVSGKPGSGKTILASALLDWLRAERSDVLTFYFFFDSLTYRSNTAIEAYRAVLSQMLQRYAKQQSVLDAFSSAMYFASDGQPTASPC
ncbi:hypothetical protein MFIFM68171_10245 [Madurella fahalii]|uniref:Nephrocystin 3-like N-terminal domain-containing protein n=1 Tax=Madurella fahalii TaxID=1157608 RepID=A0ABQ0GQM8_9PEZI